MMEWTDRHCRYFHRLLTRRARLYTEMVTTGALLHGDRPRHLDFDRAEHPVALQLGGSEPADLALCARLGERWGYDEINLNCGCPSERVQRGAFGACLMAEPAARGRLRKAMREAVSLPVTVKHRIGIDRHESYDFVRDFVGTVAEAGCAVFIVHARNAWLKGCRPKENRELPPLRYELVYRLKREFPALDVRAERRHHDATTQIAAQLEHVDGVMLGREAYHHPWTMTDWDGASLARLRRRRAGGRGGDARLPRAARAAARRAMVAGARHMLGLRNGLPGARRWRQVWSDATQRHLAPTSVASRADAMARGVGADPPAGVDAAPTGRSSCAAAA